MIIGNKHGIYMLPHDLPNDLKLAIVGNQEILRNCQKFIDLQPSVKSFYQNEIFVNTSKTLLKNRNWTFFVAAISDENQNNILFVIEGPSFVKSLEIFHRINFPLTYFELDAGKFE